jgi:hypothetical protein
MRPTKTDTSADVKPSEGRIKFFRRTKSADAEGYKRRDISADGMLSPADALQMAALSVENDKKQAKKERRKASLTDHALPSKGSEFRRSTGSSRGSSIHEMDPHAIIKMLENYAGKDGEMAADCLETLKTGSDRSKPRRTSSSDSPYKRTPVSSEGKRQPRVKRTSSSKDPKRPTIEASADWANVSISQLLDVK